MIVQIQQGQAPQTYSHSLKLHCLLQRKSQQEVPCCLDTQTWHLPKEVHTLIKKCYNNQCHYSNSQSVAAPEHWKKGAECWREKGLTHFRTPVLKAIFLDNLLTLNETFASENSGLAYTYWKNLLYMLMMASQQYVDMQIQVLCKHIFHVYGHVLVCLSLPYTEEKVLFSKHYYFIYLLHFPHNSTLILLLTCVP